MKRTKFEETFDLPSKDEFETAKTYDELANEVTEIVKSLNTTEKIDYALTTVTGLSEHDMEMDEVAAEAMKSYQRMMDMGMNCTEAHAGKIFEAANSMLRVALEAKDAKTNRKLKMIDLQLKKAKLEDSAQENAGGLGYDRNDLLKAIQQAQLTNENNSPDSDK